MKKRVLKMKKNIKKGLIEGVGFWNIRFDSEKEFNKVITGLDFHKILLIRWKGHNFLKKDLRSPFPKTTIYTNVCAPLYVINYINKNIKIIDAPNID